jgi:hypothetical protein
MPPRLGYGIGWIVGKLVKYVVITWEEVQGLMEDLLYVDDTSPATTKLTDWAKENAHTLGFTYTSELARRRDRQSEYQSN